jgi:hypothetical protein
MRLLARFLTDFGIDATDWDRRLHVLEQMLWLQLV